MISEVQVVNMECLNEVFILNIMNNTIKEKKHLSKKKKTVSTVIPKFNRNPFRSTGRSLKMSKGVSEGHVETLHLTHEHILQ